MPVNRITRTGLPPVHGKLTIFVYADVPSPAAHVYHEVNETDFNNPICLRIRYVRHVFPYFLFGLIGFAHLRSGVEKILF